MCTCAQIKADRHVDGHDIDELIDHTVKKVSKVHSEPGKIKATTKIEEEVKTP